MPVGRPEANATDQTEQGQADQTPRGETLRQELREVDEEIAALRQQAASLRSPLGGRDNGPMDLAENAAQITLAEEQEALIEVLETRRETLQRRLEAQG